MKKSILALAAATMIVPTTAVLADPPAHAPRTDIIRARSTGSKATVSRNISVRTRAFGAATIIAIIASAMTARPA